MTIRMNRYDNQDCHTESHTSLFNCHTESYVEKQIVLQAHLIVIPIVMQALRLSCKVKNKSFIYLKETKDSSRTDT